MGMVAGVPFDLYLGQFTATDLAQICGENRPVIDMMANRGFLSPTRRQRKSSTTGKPKGQASQRGRGFYSCRDAFQAKLMRVLANQVGLGLADSLDLFKDAEKKPIQAADDKILKNTAELAALVTSGEWMWAQARSIERGKPLNIYAYATRQKQEWRVDMHVGAEGQPPNFGSPDLGWNAPNIFVPMAQIFTQVYSECKKILGIETAARSEGV